MKIELLESGSDDCPVIRIYGDEPEVCQEFQRAFEQLANASVEEVLLTNLPGVEPLSGCCLIAQVGRINRGIVRKGRNSFFWVLTPTTWDNVAGLLEPFCRTESAGYQWLDESSASEARVLVSTSRLGYW
jgi:hypothetical protein